ncbi:MAG: hypothetical protein ACT4QC_17810 [Planctomycetaceae bacterium]
MDRRSRIHFEPRCGRLFPRCRGVVAAAALLFCGGTCLRGVARAGQKAAVVLAQAQPASDGISRSDESGPSYIVAILVTVALFGLALWVVCKSSRRV